MEKKFASHADVEEKLISFDKLSDNAYAYTAAGDPNTGIVIGDDAVMVIDAQATPVMADSVRRADALSRSAGARRFRLQARSHHCEPRHL